MADEPDPIVELRGELTALAATVSEQLGQLRQAFVDRADDDPGEPEPAGEESVQAAAKRAGLSVKQYRDAIAAAKRTQFREEHSSSIREIVAEVLAEQTPDPEPEPKPKPARKPAPKPDDPEPNGDQGPLMEHWSDKPFSGLFRIR